MNRGGSGPLYQRLRHELHQKILNGQWQPGERLPSERALAETYHVAVVTVQRALRDLAREGVVVRRVPAGTFVTDQPSRPHVLGVATYGTLAVNSPFFGEMVAGIQAAAHERAQLRLLAPPSEVSLAEWLKQLASGSDVDGLIVITADPVRHEDVAYLELAGFPYVLLNRRIPGHAAWCVVLDNYSVGRRAVDYFYALGHRRMAHLAGPPSVITAADRLRGFLDGLSVHGLLDPPPDGHDGASAVPPDALVYFGRFTYDMMPPAADQSGYEGMRALLARDPRLTAVFAASDAMAVGACRAVRDAGRRVPDDVSVIGMANSSVATLIEPPLTSFDYRNEELGRQAVELLIEQIEGRVARGTGAARPEARMRVVETVLAERLSCAPAPRHSAAVVAAP